MSKTKILTAQSDFESYLDKINITNIISTDFLNFEILETGKKYLMWFTYSHIIRPSRRFEPDEFIIKYLSCFSTYWNTLICANDYILTHINIYIITYFDYYIFSIDKNWISCTGVRKIQFFKGECYIFQRLIINLGIKID